jgi:CubicO group peptidase (beta-lactamase class C family)
VQPNTNILVRDLNILTRALEARFHKPLSELANEIIFKPLGMKDSHLTWDAGMEEAQLKTTIDDPGAHSICFLLPKSGQGIIIFTNSENGTKLYIDLIKAYLAEKGQAILDIELK